MPTGVAAPPPGAPPTSPAMHRLHNDLALAIATLELIGLRADLPADLRKLAGASLTSLTDAHELIESLLR